MRLRSAPRRSRSLGQFIDGVAPAAVLALTVIRAPTVITTPEHGAPVFHSAVALEVVLCLAGLAVLLTFHRRLSRRLRGGRIALMYVVLYGFVRLGLTFAERGHFVLS